MCIFLLAPYPPQHVCCIGVICLLPRAYATRLYKKTIRSSSPRCQVFHSGVDIFWFWNASILSVTTVGQEWPIWREPLRGCLEVGCCISWFANIRAIWAIITRQNFHVIAHLWYFSPLLRLVLLHDIALSFSVVCHTGQASMARNVCKTVYFSDIFWLSCRGFMT